MSGKSRSFGRFLLWGSWFPFVLAGVGVVMTALSITAKPQTYVSLAKLVAGPRMSMGGGAVGYQDYLQDFYGTIIETLESGEMRKHALERVRLLHPDLKEADVEVRVSQSPRSAVFNVAVIGLDREYTQVFLNSLLDEFKAFREMVREQQRNKAVQSLAEDVAKSRKEVSNIAAKAAASEKSINVALLKAQQTEQSQALVTLMAEKRKLRAMADFKAPPPATRPEPVAEKDAEAYSQYLMRLRDFEVQDSLRQIQGKQSEDAKQRLPLVEKQIEGLQEEISETGRKLADHERLKKDLENATATQKELFDLMHKFTVSEDIQGDYVSVMERASRAVADVQAWQPPMILAGVGGFIAGSLLLLILASIWVASGPRPVRRLCRCRAGGDQ